MFSFSAYSSERAFIIDFKRGFEQTEKDVVERWLKQGAKSVEQTIAPFPQSYLKFILIQQWSWREVVPWGQVIRGNPDTVKLHISSTATYQRLVDDWTLYHELSHLYLPYLDYPSFWLNEGFATYMQYIVMYQAKLLTREQFIERMAAGFERGYRKTLSKPGKLKDVSDDMWQRRAHKRVYWSGAAFFLEADLILHSQGSSLAEVIKKYVACCRVAESYGQILVQEFDRLAGKQVFSKLFKQYAEREDFPIIKREQLEQLADNYQP